MPAVLRPGGVTLEQLQACLPVVRRLEPVEPVDDSSARPASPGMLAKHYSPEAEVLLFSGPADAVTAQMQQAAQAYMAQGRRVVVLVTDEERALFSGLPVYGLGPVHDLAQVGQNLFAALRTLDERGVEVIITRLFDPAGLGTTLNDRLLRAAEGKIAHVSG